MSEERLKAYEHGVRKERIVYTPYVLSNSRTWQTVAVVFTNTNDRYLLIAQSRDSGYYFEDKDHDFASVTVPYK